MVAVSAIGKVLFEKIVEKAPDIVRGLAKDAATTSVENLEEWIHVCEENASSHRNYPRVLQDLINVVGERLGFNVTFGEYGRGPDGVWVYGDVKIVIEVKASSYHLNITEFNKRVDSEKATCGVAICSSFMEDKVLAAKQYPKIRLLTSGGLCKLLKLKEDYQLPTEHVVNILIPQEAVQLDGLIELIYGVIEARGKVPPLKDRYDINDVPDDIKNLGEVTKAMYIVLRENPDREFTAEDLTKLMLEYFPATFKEYSPKSISFGTVWSGDALEKKGYVTIQRVKPDPEKYPDWVQRKYKFKGTPQPT
jgi:hypothetical protein